MGPLLAIQPFSHPLTLTFPGHWATLGNYERLGLPGKTISLSGLRAANTRHMLAVHKTGSEIVSPGTPER